MTRARDLAKGTFSGDLTVDTNTLVVDSANNSVGIGNTSPSSFGKVRIDVAGTTTPTNATNVGPSSINLYAPTNGGLTDCTVGIFGWQAGQPGIGSGIGFSRENVGDWGSQIRFYTHPTTTSNISDITERMRIDSSGNVLVGTQATPSATNSGFMFTSDQLFTATTSTSLNYQVRFYNGNGLVGAVTTNGSATAFLTSSDYRLKTDAQPMTGASDRVLALKPVNFAVDFNRYSCRWFPCT
jgi:hypothetical protein